MSKYLYSVCALFVLGGAAYAQQNDAADEPAVIDQQAPSEEELAAEDAAVDEVLAEAELIYKEQDEGDFIPSQQVSADQSLDYPVDI